MYDYRARFYDPLTANFLSPDSIVPGVDNPLAWNRFAYVMGNPVRYSDPSGHFGWPPLEEWVRTAKQATKQGITEFIVVSAEAAHYVYIPVANKVSEYPRAINSTNLVLDYAGGGVESVTNMDPDSLGWTDLFNMWQFEFGPDTIEFGPNAITTKDLMRDRGTLKARQMALDAIANGNISEPIEHPLDYNVGQYYNSLGQFAEDGTLTTIFTGSYLTTIDITDIGDGYYKLNYTVFNVSGWESATRFRRGPNGRLGVVPDKERGEGLHLGGNFTQYWHWSETVSPNVRQK